METIVKENVLQVTKSSKVVSVEDIQSLWAGHGVIQRITLKGGEYPTVILKNIDLVKGNSHPRGWDTNFSHQRKIKSYDVETAWYEKYNKLNNVDKNSKTPHCITSYNKDNKIFILLEDLDHSGFPERVDTTTHVDIELCLKWLAHFHAKFMGSTPKNLWEIGTYWHLSTRPDELKNIEGTKLHKWAKGIDTKLNNSPYKTIVHGDAKVANFCFARARDKVAAVDFQYVGGGCGMKDVAYFIGSCRDEGECKKFEQDILPIYFNELQTALKINNKNIDFKELEQDWRSLYYYAWTDFYRFLKGWSPDHWKINEYSDSVATKIINELESKR